MELAFGSFTIRLYGLILATAVFFPTFLIARLLHSKKLITNSLISNSLRSLDTWDALLWALIPALIGARLYHVAHLWDFYKLNPVLIPQFWIGGIGIIGGILGGAFGLYLYSRRIKAPFLTITDIGVVGLALGQAIGRLGNWANGELLPFALYESAWDFVSFLILLFLLVRIAKGGGKNPEGKTPGVDKETPGVVEFRGFPFGRGFLTSVYLILYGLGRSLLETLREGSWSVAAASNNIPVAQIFSLTFVLAGIILLLYASKKKVPH